MRAVVTEVTYMQAGQVCVAAWLPAEQRMVRPLSSPYRHWPQELASDELFSPGNVLRLVPARVPGARGLPNAREDLVLEGIPRLLERRHLADHVEELRRSEASSLQALFEGCLEHGRFVRAGSDCPSLGSIPVDSRRMRFYTRPKETGVKLRCWFVDDDDARYNLPVVGKEMTDLFASDGTEPLDAARKRAQHAHVRIGLAHPLGDGRAFAMVNGILFYRDR